MSSSPISWSSSDPETIARALSAMHDVVCPVEVLLGTGGVSVRRCLELREQSVLRLDQPAGADLMILVTDAPIARGEVVVIDDSTAVRVTTVVDRARPSL
jgi:flagellar motor switch/type III secretory pathway protein FliN